MFRRPEQMVSVSCGLCLLLAWFGAVNGWRLLRDVLLAASVHELGHTAALYLLGGSLRGLRLTLLGAVLELDGARLSYGRELACVLAGPGANLLLALILTRFGGAEYDALTGASLSLCAFNLLPVRPLDGGRALELTVCVLAGPVVGETAARAAGILFAGGACAGLTALMWTSGGSLWLFFPTVCFLKTFLRECCGKTAVFARKP